MATRLSVTVWGCFLVYHFLVTRKELCFSFIPLCCKSSAACAAHRAQNDGWSGARKRFALLAGHLPIVVFPGSFPVLFSATSHTPNGKCEGEKQSVS